MIVEWPATQKTALSASSKRGVVAVRYDGCELELLDCLGKGTYNTTPISPISDGFDVRTADDLYAKLPIGAFGLEAKLGGGARLVLDYVSVGQQVASGAERFAGTECHEATHYVRAMIIGAYELKQVQELHAGAGVDTPVFDLGGKHEEHKKILRSAGKLEACRSEGEGESKGTCDSILQLSLTPLSQGSVGGGAVGFGRDLGTVTKIPTVQGIKAVQPSSFQNVDVQMYQLLQAALRADGNEEALPVWRATAWEQLAAHKNGEHDLAAKATTRAQQWRNLHAAQVKRREDLLTLQSKFLADKQKLDQLLELDDEVVSAEQKTLYEREFELTYAPFEDELDEAANLPGGDALAEAVESADTIADPRPPIDDFWAHFEGGFMFLSMDENHQSISGVESEHMGGFGMGLVGISTDFFRAGAMFRGGGADGVGVIQFGGRLELQIDTGWALVNIPLDVNYSMVADEALDGVAFGPGLHLDMPVGSVVWLGASFTYNAMIVSGDSDIAEETGVETDGVAHGLMAGGLIGFRGL